MSSQVKHENLVTEIKKIRKDIKRKHRALTGNTIMEQQELEKQFEPITQPLKKLIYKIYFKIRMLKWMTLKHG